MILLLAAPARAADFSAELLTTGGDRIREIRAIDMTGDGKPEIIAFAEGETGPSVHVFLLDGEGSGPRAADAIHRPAEGGQRAIYYMGLAKLEAGKGHEIVTTDRLRGVMATALSPAEIDGDAAPAFLPSRKIAEAPPLPFFPDEDRPALLDVGLDLDGDGVDELLLPTLDGYLVVRPGSGKEPVLLETGAAHSLTTPGHRFFSLGWEIPRLTVVDWDGDGIRDLVAGRGGEFLLFLQRRDGTFLRATRPLDVLRTPSPGGDLEIPLLADVDGDGRTDLVLTSTPSSVGVLDEFSSRQSLFLGPEILSAEVPGALSTPRSTVKTEGISVNTTLLDFDGDGDLDLLVTSLALTVRSRIRNRVTAEYKLFLYDSKSRGFERSPYFQVTRSFPMEQLERSSTSPVCFFSGDFNGDGLRDLLDIADDGHVTILAGTKDTGILSTARYTFHGELFRAAASMENDPVIADLDGDGISDVVGYSGSSIYVIRSVK